MKILITGADGYIGSHLCSLLDRLYDITAFDLEFTKNTLPESCKKVQGDIMDYKFKDKFDVVIHLAAYISVEESVKIPAKYYNNNYIATKSFLSQFSDDTHIIFSSTAAAFDPINMYGNSKLLAEKYIQDNIKRYTIFRFFNVGGSDGKNNFTSDTHLIYKAAEAAKYDKELVIFGEDYDTKDGTCERDYIHVMDIVKAIKSNIGRPLNTKFECLKNEYQFTNLEVVSMMNMVSPLDFTIGERREGDEASSSTMKRYKNFKPRYTLYDICLSTYNKI